MRPTHLFRILGLVMLSTLAPQSIAATQAVDHGDARFVAPNWDAGQARRLATSSDSTRLYATLRRALARDPSTLPAVLAVVAGDTASWPERESAILRFTASLHDYRGPRPALSPLLDVLARWQPRTLVAHEESAALGTPMFSIAAQAQGLQNRWTREAASASAARSLDGDGTGFLAAWSGAADPLDRAGALDALGAASRSQRQAVLRSALARLASDPAMTEPAAVAAMSLHDMPAITTLIERGAPGGLRALLDDAARGLSAAQMNVILSRLHKTSPERTALALGVWSGKLAGDRRTEALLIGLLDDRLLGASAALALSRAPSPAALARLQTMAVAKRSGLAAARARMALQLDGLPAEEFTP